MTPSLRSCIAFLSHIKLLQWLSFRFFNFLFLRFFIDEISNSQCTLWNLVKRVTSILMMVYLIGKWKKHFPIFVFTLQETFAITRIFTKKYCVIYRHSTKINFLVTLKEFRNYQNKVTIIWWHFYKTTQFNLILL